MRSNQFPGINLHSDLALDPIPAKWRLSTEDQEQDTKSPSASRQRHPKSKFEIRKFSALPA